MKVERSMYDTLNTKAMVGKTLSDKERKALRLLASKFRDNALTEADVPDADWRDAVGDGLAFRAALQAKKAAKGLEATREAARTLAHVPRMNDDFVARITPIVEDLVVIVEAQRGSPHVSLEQWEAARSELTDLHYGLGRSPLESAKKLVVRIDKAFEGLNSLDESDAPPLEQQLRKDLARKIRESRRAR